MNVESESAPATDASESVEDTAAATVKPVRRRRAVAKAAEQPVPGADEAALPAVDSEPAAPAEPAAKPKRRRAVTVASEGADLIAEPSAESPADGASVRAAVPPVEAPRAAPSVDIADDGLAAHVVAGSTALAKPPESVGGEAEAVGAPVTESDGASASADTADAPSALDEGGPGGRRRNRRDRNRGERPERQATAEGAAVNEPRAVQAAPVEVGQVFAQVLSGEFDVDGEAPAEPEAADETAAPKRVLAPEPDAPKLHKVLAQSGIGSRRDMEALIEGGEVSVNGETAHVGQRVSFGDRVLVKGKPVRLRILPPPPRIIAYHKPVGEIVTHDDPQNRPTVFRRLPRLQQGKWQSVGRLDINTEGLLLFTNSGELANQLMHPRFAVEREYAVRVLGDFTPELRAKLIEGVEVDGQPASFRSIEDGGGDGANHWYRVVITEGRNREVRKLFDAVGLTVSRLIRIRYGTVVLPFGLKRGVWVDLDSADVGAIRRLAGGEGAPRQERGERPRGNEPRAGATPPQRADRPNDRQGPRGGNGNANAMGGNNQPAGPRDRPRSNGPRPPEAPRLASFEVAPRAESDMDGDIDFDFDPMSIPNPLEQTFDKRFVQNPRSPAGGRGFRNGGGGFGAGGSAPDPVNKKGQAGPKQPDPLQTSLGFIGADAFHRKNRGGGGGNQGGGGGPRGTNRGGPRGTGGGGGGGGFGGGFGGGRRGR